ncbi:MAG: hypothetical protein QE271_00670 [Bacteriovoracaceae bacterium]|nr:hypothetical protein [Bacteriovoracaceae bacterium]
MKWKLLFFVFFFVTTGVLANQEMDNGTITCQYSWYGPGPAYSNYEVKHFSASRSYRNDGLFYTVNTAFSEAQDEARTRCESYKLYRGNGSCGLVYCR